MNIPIPDDQIAYITDHGSNWLAVAPEGFEFIKDGERVVKGDYYWDPESSEMIGWVIEADFYQGMLGMKHLQNFRILKLEPASIDYSQYENLMW